MRRNASISGTHLRYDVPTKCAAVATVLGRTYPTKKHMNDTISALAADMEVNPVTIKLWVSKYHKTYKLGLNLPTGTMAHSFNVIPSVSISRVNSELHNIRAALTDIAVTFETSAVTGISAADLRTTATPKEILNELIENQKSN